ncbi:MAG: thiolase family protein [Nitrospirae bacterium]|nr:MAG: thiolase family protein [Nitrospirota bacterium]
MQHAVIAATVRTPIGNLNGALSSMSATELGSCAIRESMHRAAIAPEDVDEVIMGNVLSAGLGQAPARQAAKGAHLPDHVNATTVNQVCGSGLKAVIMAADSICAGSAEIVVAGGMESMSGAPYLLHKARAGYQVGHGELVDSMIKDGLWDAYGNKHMGSCAELCASKYLFDRDQQDDFAVQSYTKALTAQQQGSFQDEIIPVDVKTQEGSVRVHEDERPKRFNEGKLRRLMPAFQPDGTITAGNATGMNDGAAAMLVLAETRAQALGIHPVARILGFTQKSMAPDWFTIAPIVAIQALLKKLRMQAHEFDLYEINEAFAAVPLAAMRDLELCPDHVNVHGGAIALGHPLGASGARVLTTLIHALKRIGGKRGIASLCIGGGGGIALAVEMYDHLDTRNAE